MSLPQLVAVSERPVSPAERLRITLEAARGEARQMSVDAVANLRAMAERAREIVELDEVVPAGVVAAYRALAIKLDAEAQGIEAIWARLGAA